MHSTELRTPLPKPLRCNGALCSITELQGLGNRIICRPSPTTSTAPARAPGRLPQRGGLLLLWAPGVAHQQVAKAGSQLGGVRALGRIVPVWGVHARRIRPDVSGVATVPARRCSGAPSHGLSCLRLPGPAGRPAGTDCPREARGGNRRVPARCGITPPQPVVVHAARRPAPPAGGTVRPCSADSSRPEGRNLKAVGVSSQAAVERKTPRIKACAGRGTTRPACVTFGERLSNSADHANRTAR